MAKKKKDVEHLCSLDSDNPMIPKEHRCSSCGGLAESRGDGFYHCVRNCGAHVHCPEVEVTGPTERPDSPETVIRAIELPISRIEKVGGGTMDGWKLLREAWEHSTLLANWCVHQLIRHDVVVVPGMEKLPRMPEINGERLKGLYGLAQEQEIACSKRGCEKTGHAHWWHGAAQSISCICKQVQDKYTDERIDVLWRRCRSLATYRYPYPWPVHGQSWKEAGLDSSGKPYVIVALPGGQAKITLRGGPEFFRQMTLFKEIVSGNLPRKQLILRRQLTSSSCHRPTVKDQGRNCRVMCKMVVEIPKKEKPGDRTLVLMTDPCAFWVAELDGRRAWILNGDHLKKLVYHDRHLHWLQRVSEDGKAERRMGNNRHYKVQRRLERASDKDRNRLCTWTHETAAHLVKFCVRQGVGEVFYLDRDKGFVEKFPWFELHNKLSQKLELEGITLYSESGSFGSNPIVDGPDDDDGGSSSGEITPSAEDEKWLRIDRLREQATKKIVKSRSRKSSHGAVTKP